MKLQFKHQKFQADAAKAICDVFAGQPYRSSSFGIDPGYGQLSLTDNEDFLGYGNTRISNDLNDVMILEQIRKIQRSVLIEPSKQLEGRYNLSV